MGTEVIKCPSCGISQTFHAPGVKCKACRAVYEPSPNTPPSSIPTTIDPVPDIPEAQGPSVSADRPHQSAMPALPPTVPADQSPRYQMSFLGRGAELLAVHTVNVFLTLITLGIYYFWGKARILSYLFSHTDFESDRFGYHGTGKEMFLGFLKALLVFGIPVAALNVAPEIFGADTPVQGMAAMLGGVIVLVFIPIAIAGARRYRLSRTSWRGIRFSFRGSVREFMTLYVGNLLATVCTLGLFYPIFATKVQKFLANDSYFGNQKFSFDGEGKDLIGSFLIAIVLTIPTLGLCWFWFSAKKTKYFWEHTSLNEARFEATITGGSLLGLKFVNALLLIVTLGLAWPWVVIRNIHFTFCYLTLAGPLDLDSIHQDAQAASATGEGLAGFLDTGAEFT